MLRNATQMIDNGDALDLSYDKNTPYISNIELTIKFSRDQ